MAALPPALNVFVLGRQYEAWVEPASGSVLLGTLVSVVTLTTVMWLVQHGVLDATYASARSKAMQPLVRHSGARFHHAAAGPLATLLLAEAGAEVIKIERPGGEDMRHYEPRFDGESAMFALLNRGKTSLVLDLKSDADRDKLDAAAQARRRAGRAVPARCDGAARPRLRRGARDQSASSSTARSPAMARPARAPARPGTTSTTSATPGCWRSTPGRPTGRWCRRR